MLEGKGHDKRWEMIAAECPLLLGEIFTRVQIPSAPGCAIPLGGGGRHQSSIETTMEQIPNHPPAEVFFPGNQALMMLRPPSCPGVPEYSKRVLR